MKSSANPAELAARLSRISPPSVLSEDGDGEFMVRSKISSKGFLEDKLEDSVV